MQTVKIVETYSDDASSPPHDASPLSHGELAPSSGTTQTELHARRRYIDNLENSQLFFLPVRREGPGTLHKQPIENCHSQMIASMADQ